MKNAVPLPLQIMACVAIEVFSNDGMPQMICDECRYQAKKSYLFKAMCKKSDDALKLYLATGIFPNIEKEDILKARPNTKRLLEENTSSHPIPKHVKMTETSTQFEPDDIEEPVLETVEEPDPMEAKIINTIRHIKDQIISEKKNIEENLGATSSSEKSSSAKLVATHVFPCDQCERSFPLQQLLDIHMRQHNRERKFTCETCDKKFFTKHDLAKHEHLHKGQKDFTCVVCNRAFSRQTLLHRHEKIHVTAPKFICNYCEKSYLNADDLDAHVLTHKRKRPYKCNECYKTFAFKQGLERHEASHIAENKFKCDYCEEAFNSAAKLTRHISTHVGSRPYPCKFCHRTFRLSHHLTRHLKNHYSQRPVQQTGEYKCDFCSMSFRKQQSLISHTAIHSMVNLKCVICNKDFSDAQTVKLHVETHLAGLEYQCILCDYSFDIQEELEEHEAMKHPDNNEEYLNEEENEMEQENPYEVEYVLKSPDPEEIETVQEESSTSRRSLRESKVKNYADFFKDENSNDFEDEKENDDTYEPEKIESPPTQKLQVASIPPVIRSDTMRTYQRTKDKTNSKILPLVNKAEGTESSNPTVIDTPDCLPKLSGTPRKITKITTLENLGITQQTLDAITDKSGFAEMKMGQKVVRVQKLKMTKAEYEAMANKNIIKIDGNRVIIQNVELSQLKQISKKMTQNQKSPIRTYIKPMKIKQEEDESARTEEQPDNNPEIEPDMIADCIDLESNEDTNNTIKPMFLESFD